MVGADVQENFENRLLKIGENKKLPEKIYREEFSGKILLVKFASI